MRFPVKLVEHKWSVNGEAGRGGETHGSAIQEERGCARGYHPLDDADYWNNLDRLNWGVKINNCELKWQQQRLTFNYKLIINKFY